jgi:hypothetical protein
MAGTTFLPALIIHLVAILSGLLLFVRLNKQMQREAIIDAPTAALFMIFISYGGLLMLVLTSLFWEWSPMASLGTLYLAMGAPLVMGAIAYRHKNTKNLSKYHSWTYRAALLYFLVAPATFLTLFLLDK